jgi:hypothetical protein
MLNDLPSGDPDEITVRIRLEPGARALRLPDSNARPVRRAPIAILAAALALAGALAVLAALG